jgi:hypothetical protein
MVKTNSKLLHVWAGILVQADSARATSGLKMLRHERNEARQRAVTDVQEKLASGRVVERDQNPKTDDSVVTR